MKRAFELKGPDRVLHIHHTPCGPEHVEVELRPILDAGREVVACVERLVNVRNASARPSADGLVGRSAAFNAALSALQRVAPSMLPVPLLGEPRTGQASFARAAREASLRVGHPLAVVDGSGVAGAGPRSRTDRAADAAAELALQRGWSERTLYRRLQALGSIEAVAGPGTAKLPSAATLAVSALAARQRCAPAASHKVAKSLSRKGFFRVGRMARNLGGSWRWHAAASLPRRHRVRQRREPCMH